jgi:hypothetical protein
MSEGSGESQPSTLPAASLRSKVKEVVSLNIHDEDLQFALMQLSKLEESREPSGGSQMDKDGAEGEDDVHGRKAPFGRIDVRVREMLEESNLHSYDMFLSSFTSFMEDFSHVQNDIETLGRSCAKMQDSVSTTRERSKEALRLFDDVKNRRCANIHSHIHQDSSFIPYDPIPSHSCVFNWIFSLALVTSWKGRWAWLLLFLSGSSYRWRNEKRFFEELWICHSFNCSGKCNIYGRRRNV